jgi:pyrroline-5-carboxylate reductase
MKTGFIGAGKMGEAIIAALIGSGTSAPGEILACDVSVPRRRYLKRKYRIAVFPQSAPVISGAGVLFLGVKPQDLDALLTEIAPAVTRRHLVLSIAAGKTIAALEALLPRARVIRVMPNLPALVSEGMSVMCAGRRATEADRRKAARLLGSFGEVLELPEKHFDAVTAVSGSGPAFLAFLTDCLARAGQAEGLRRRDALLLAKQTMLGTARLLTEKGLDPGALVKAVTSAKGTTAAGFEVLGRSDVPAVLARTVRAAARRSAELSR